MELDVAWCVKGGVEPIAWMAKNSDRIAGIHVKDIAPAGEAEDEDGWADVGHGTMDWGRLLTALEGSSVRHFIVEHDRPNDDRRFARRSLETLNALTRS
jgi:sugar phosphate isomerase/epimerase